MFRRYDLSLDLRASQFTLAGWIESPSISLPSSLQHWLELSTGMPHIQPFKWTQTQVLHTGSTLLIELLLTSASTFNFFFLMVVDGVALLNTGPVNV